MSRKIINFCDEVEQKRNNTKKDLLSGKLTLKQLLTKLDKTPHMQNVRVFDALMSLPNMTQTKALNLINATDIYSWERLKNLSDKQKRKLNLSYVINKRNNGE